MQVLWGGWNALIVGLYLTYLGDFLSSDETISAQDRSPTPVKDSKETKVDVTQIKVFQLLIVIVAVLAVTFHRMLYQN